MQCFSLSFPNFSPSFAQPTRRLSKGMRNRGISGSPSPPPLSFLLVLPPPHTLIGALREVVEQWDCENINRFPPPPSFCQSPFLFPSRSADSSVGVFIRSHGQADANRRIRDSVWRVSVPLFPASLPPFLSRARNAPEVPKFTAAIARVCLSPFFLIPPSPPLRQLRGRRVDVVRARPHGGPLLTSEVSFPQSAPTKRFRSAAIRQSASLRSPSPLLFLLNEFFSPFSSWIIRIRDSAEPGTWGVFLSFSPSPLGGLRPEKDGIHGEGCSPPFFRDSPLLLTPLVSRKGEG